MKNDSTPKKSSLNTIRKEIQYTHLMLIVIITIMLSFGGALININASSQKLDQNLMNTSKLISRLYGFTRLTMDESSLTEYFNSIGNENPDVDIISIVDSKNIRVYHTNNSLIGTEYTGTIPKFDKGGKEFHVENENGPSGLQRRTYSAIYDENGNYDGFIMTIILKTSIHSVTKRTTLLFICVTLAAILIEIIISGTLSRKIRQKLHGYEPDTFSAMYSIRDNILESIQEGIIAIDGNKDIQFINGVAKRILFNDESGKVRQINEKLFTEKIFNILSDRSQEIKGLRESSINGTQLLIDCIPVKTDESERAAIAIIHDRTEYTKLMEDLSGTKYLVDSMRANNHDFTNKLHVILGLIQIGQYDHAVSYIENISMIQRETISKIMNSIENPNFAALLIGKIARASECNVKFILKEGLCFRESDIHLPSESLVTIAGNLIDNALDAMNTTQNIRLNDTMTRELQFGVFTKSGELLMSVSDNGCGISDENRDKVWMNGFSTKGSGRGIGLYQTKMMVENLNGTIYFETAAGKGTCFTVRIPGEK